MKQYEVHVAKNWHKHGDVEYEYIALCPTQDIANETCKAVLNAHYPGKWKLSDDGQQFVHVNSYGAYNVMAFVSREDAPFWFSTASRSK